MEELNDLQDVSFIQAQSFENWVVLFKHSTRCSISSMALNRFKTILAELENAALVYYLDLIKYRNISNKLAEVFNIQHESPQVLIIKDGKCVYHASHLNINTSDIMASIASVKNK